MIHPKQDEIRRLIENWQAWTGDGKGAVYSTSPIAWTDEAYGKLEQRRSQVNVIKPIGAEAQLTGETLVAMPAREARALKAYYLSSMTAQLIAREYLRCSRRTFVTLVARGHSSFWELYLARKRGAAAMADEVARWARQARP